MLSGKKILLAVCGGIAAYKSVYLLRLLVSAGAEVKVILTENAQDFVGAITFSTLSDNPVYTSVIKDGKTGEWTNHVALAHWADALLIAPATSKTMSKIVMGLADNLLVLTQMSFGGPTFIAPAMDLEMHASSAQQSLQATLKTSGFKIIDAESGFLASGLSGKGRMASENRIFECIENHFLAPNPILQGKKVLINAGPTHEALDPVRYLANRSTGKMGYALARAAYAFGADVTLVSGPSNEAKPHGVDCVEVKSAQEMFDACSKYFLPSDLVIASAAVADYTPAKISEQKIKKNEDVINIKLSKTKDILAYFGEHKTTKQCVVGFALESQNALEYGRMKLHKKKCNFMVVNSLEDDGAGFAHDTNSVTLIHEKGEETAFSLESKKILAFKLLENIAKHLH